MKKQELNYFDEFIKNVDFAQQTSKILKEYVENFDSTKSEEMEEKVHSLEHTADRNLHNILNYLIKDFLPPIDREDIIMLGHKIDDVCDCIDEVAINLDILGITNLRDDFKEFTYLIYDCCTTLKELMIAFKNIKKSEETRKLIVSVNIVEEAGDKLYQTAIKSLYQSEKNPIEVTKWNIMYNCLEDCFDACENVADCVEEIIMKNS